MAGGYQSHPPPTPVPRVPHFYRPLVQVFSGGMLDFLNASEFPMRHIISALVQNVPGVLSHISGMLASRGYNIDSLAVGETDNPQLSRMTFVVVGDDSILEQVRKQLEKIVTVVRVDDIGSSDHVERDLILIKVMTPGSSRSEIRELTDIFRGRIVDVAHDMVMIEMSGQERKIEAFIEMMRPFGIVELVRTGRIAMLRGRECG
jgi:acetolactate synthase I/III small subunit